MTAPSSGPSSAASARSRNARKISAETSMGVTSRAPPATASRTTGPSPGAKTYGVSFRVASASWGPRPMNRFTDAMVSRGCCAASPSASRPTTRPPPGA